MTAATAPTLAPPCADQPHLWHREEGDRHHDWWRTPAAICGHCPIRRRCIEQELDHGRPVDGSVWGGWVFTTRAVHPHRDDLDLYRKHYTLKETR